MFESIFNEALANQLVWDLCMSSHALTSQLSSMQMTHVLILPTDEIQIQHTKCMFLHITAYTSLKANCNKSIMVSINVSAAKMQLPTSTLGCIQGNFPFNYMGLPLSVIKSKTNEFVSLLHRIERSLVGCSTFLS